MCLRQALSGRSAMPEALVLQGIQLVLRCNALEDPVWDENDLNFLIPALGGAATHRDPLVRLGALQALSGLPSASLEIQNALQRGCDDAKRCVRKVAMAALNQRRCVSMEAAR